MLHVHATILPTSPSCLLQVAYAAVTLAGYITYFAPELLQLGKSGQIAADGRQRHHPAPANAHQSAAEQVDQAACKGPDQGAVSPPTHSMQLHERKLQTKAHFDMEGSSVLSSSMPARESSAASQLLEPRMLRLCGSFTLQVRPVGWHICPHAMD